VSIAAAAITGGLMPGRLEWAILDLLLERPQQWGIGELVDALGNPAAIAEAIDTLRAAGLIERGDAFVRIAGKPTP
jgi:hypothetical protein